MSTFISNEIDLNRTEYTTTTDTGAGTSYDHGMVEMTFAETLFEMVGNCLPEPLTDPGNSEGFQDQLPGSCEEFFAMQEIVQGCMGECMGPTRRDKGHMESFVGWEKGGGYMEDFVGREVTWQTTCEQNGRPHGNGTWESMGGCRPHCEATHDFA